MTTTDVLARLKKILRGSRASYTHWVSRQPAEISIDPDGATGAGQATVFVSHAWKYPFSLSCEVIGSYAKELMKQANAKHHPGTVAVKGKNNKTIFKPYFWFDIFTVNQFEAATYPQDFWTTTFKEQVLEIGHTLLILHPWDRPIPLTRAWCVWEMYCTMDTLADFHIRQSKVDAERLDRALAMDPKGTMEMVANIDTANAEAWKESDREMIHAAVEGSVGFAALNEMVRDRMIAFMTYLEETGDTLFFEAGEMANSRFQLSDDALGKEFTVVMPKPTYEEPPAFEY